MSEHKEDLGVGFVGLGNQDGSIARQIALAGFPLSLWPDALSLSSLSRTFPRCTSSLRELGETSDVVCVCAVADVEDAVLGGNILAGMREGGILVVRSTIHPATCRRIAGIAAGKGSACS